MPELRLQDFFFGWDEKIEVKREIQCPGIFLNSFQLPWSCYLIPKKRESNFIISSYTIIKLKISSPNQVFIILAYD